MRFGTAVLIVPFFLTTGCAAIRSVTMPPEDNLLSGAGSIMVENKSVNGFEQINMNNLLKEYGLDAATTVAAAAPADEAKYKYLRNDMQDRILAASNQRCGYYLREIVSAKSQTQMGWGSLALLLSGAAAVTTPASAAQILSAGAAVSTGVNSLYNEAYFNNLAVNVISSGITKHREGILVQITKLRQLSLADYPVNRAVADAIRYHSACNIISGLETAAAATNNPAAPPVSPKLQ